MPAMTVLLDLPLLAFSGDRLIARGAAADVLPAIKAAADGGDPVLILDAATGRAVDLDLRGSEADALARLVPPPAPERRGPGRPRLGVVAREVTLMPRHWEWLSAQPGGASVALRKLVEARMKMGEGAERARRAKEATYRLLTTLAGDRPGYEEATRMLFAGDWTAFDAAVADWPEDVREAAKAMAEGAWRNGVV